jgi:hypothetical protein
MLEGVLHNPPAYRLLLEYESQMVGHDAGVGARQSSLVERPPWFCNTH